MIWLESQYSLQSIFQSTGSEMHNSRTETSSAKNEIARIRVIRVLQKWLLHNESKITSSTVVFGQKWFAWKHWGISIWNNVMTQGLYLVLNGNRKVSHYSWRQPCYCEVFSAMRRNKHCWCFKGEDRKPLWCSLPIVRFHVEIGHSKIFTFTKFRLFALFCE